MRILISIAIIFSLLSPNWLIGTDEELYGTPDVDYEFVGRIWNETPDEIKQTWPSEYLAYGVGLSSWEFNYMARVVQAESNGTYDWSDFEDKVHIAAVIFNRKDSRSFYNTISGVLDEPGQFSTTSGSFILTCIVFAIPIATAFLIKAEYDNFGIFVLVAISLAEFISVLLIIYFGSEED